MGMPKQKPGNSKQDFKTPSKFIDACVKRFGPITLDLAANEGNHVVDRWYGPGGVASDSLDSACDWHAPQGGWAWLNPEFRDIEPWAKRCAEEQRFGGRILMLTPASIGSEWFRNHVCGIAEVIGLSPRLSFMESGEPYPKDCMLSVFDRANGYHFHKERPSSHLECWRWRI